MKAALAIVKRMLLMLVRQKSSFLYMFVMPILFTFLFGIVPNFNTKSPITMVDEDHSKLSRAIVSLFEQDGAFRVKVTTAQVASSDVKNGATGVVITLPSGLEHAVLAGEPLHVTLTPSPNANTYGRGQSDILNEVESKLLLWGEAGRRAVESAHVRPNDKSTSDSASTISRFIAGATRAEHTPSPVLADNRLFQDGRFDNYLTEGQHAVVGFATMFIMFTIFSMTGSIFEEKRQGTWSRFKASPVPRASILAGYSIGFFVMGWLQFLVMMLTGRILFGVSLPVNLWMVAAVSLYILAAVGIALCVSGLVRTKEQHMAIGSFVVIATCMIGGAYWPVEVEPVWMQHVAWFVPQNWAMSALKLIALGSTTFHALVWPLTVLFGFAVIFFTAGIVQLRYS
jgi:ABC-2 type transport system permease protein